MKTPTVSSESDAAKQTENQIARPKLPSTGETTYVNPQNTHEAVQKKKAEMKKVCISTVS